MKQASSKKEDSSKNNLNYKLVIIEALIFGLPFLIFSYLLYESKVQLNVSQIILLMLTAIIIVSGLIILRQIFNRIIKIAKIMKKAEAGDMEEIDIEDDTTELREISISFNELMKSFEDTTDELKQRVFELFTIKELIEIASKSIDIDDLLNILLEKAMAVTRAEVGSVFMVDQEEKRFRVVASSGLEHGPQKGSYIGMDDSLARNVVSEKRPLTIRDIETDPLTRRSPDPFFGSQSLLSMPVFVGRDVISVLNLSQKETKEPFDSNDEQILSIMLGEISFALENARLHSLLEDNFKRLNERTAELEREINTRKRIEEKLWESERRYEVATKAGQVGVWDWILETDEIYIDPNLKAMIGYEDHEIRNHMDDWIKLVHPDDQDQMMAEAKLHLEGLKPKYEVVHRMLHKDGSIRWFLARGNAARDENGRPYRMFGANSDITERKRMEEELAKVQKLESLGVLAGGIAHDFNNMLTAISGNISLAGMLASSGKDVSGVLDEAKKASLRAKDLTKQLITFAKGGVPVKKTVSIAEVIKDSCQFALSGSRSRCELRLADDLRPAEIDVEQISQAINSLLINADQAIAEGGVIEVSAENITIGEEDVLPLMHGDYLRITIKDYGVGIPEEDLPKIFDPFFTTKLERSGLGLATANSIVTNHGGHISAESRIGEGTTFHVYLPASDKKILPEEVVVEIPPVGEGKILIMDDEELVRKVAGIMLERIGYEVSFAEDGAKAIEIYKKALETGQPFDVVILDLTVPGGMGGKGAIERLRKIDPDVKAIVSSGYSTDPIMAEFKKYGFIGVVPKPYGPEELARVVGQVISEDKNKSG